jgi:hypothetical protein
MLSTLPEIPDVVASEGRELIFRGLPCPQLTRTSWIPHDQVFHGEFVLPPLFDTRYVHLLTSHLELMTDHGDAKRIRW